MFTYLYLLTSQSSPSIETTSFLFASGVHSFGVWSRCTECLFGLCRFVCFVLFFVVDCQADFDIDNVQRRELVNLYGV